MKRYTNLTLYAAAALSATLFVSCKNPADETANAVVKDTQKAAQGSPSGTSYHFSPDSSIHFIGSKITGSHEGGFKTFDGSFQLTNGEPTSGSFNIDMNSVWSDAEKLTGHLKSEDFFSVSQFPKASFVATAFEKQADHTYLLSGNLTLRGVTKNITFPATVTGDESQFNLVSEFDINRYDWNIVYKGKADDLIRKEVVIKLALKATPAE